jgi:nucleoside-diphosphate-sugar epimerase
MTKETILVSGANGQIGSVLTEALRAKYGTDSVLATDIRMGNTDHGPFELLDILDANQLSRIVRKYKVTQIYHLAAILSATGEKNPRMAWDINTNGLFNVLEVAREFKMRLFFPSSIAVFGSHTPRSHTPQETIIHPETVYGISKAAGENWCQYYYMHYDVDVRSIRYPGIIGYQSLPGGGTTDYAVDIYHKAIAGEAYECFLKEDAMLPMMYMDDAIKATLSLMDAPEEKIKVRTSYNLAAMSFTPAQVALEIQKYYPDFKIKYKPDFRQEIADTWPETIDDHQATEDWGWHPDYDLKTMTVDMIENLKKMQNK